MCDSQSSIRFFLRSRKENGEDRSNHCVVRRRAAQGDEDIEGKAWQRQRKEERANGGCLGYPEAMKDVVSCEKARGSANRN